MNKKCEKYKSLYIFRTEEELENHLKVCLDCAQQHEEFLEIEKFIKSAKPFHKKKKQLTVQNKIKTFTASIALVIVSSMLIFNSPEFIEYPDNSHSSEVKELINNSLFNQMNLPTDEYGILNPHKEIIL